MRTVQIELASCWLFLLVAFSGIACATTAGRECFVQIPVYDPHGNHLPFEIVTVSVDVKDGIDLLTNNDPGRRAAADRETLYFPKALLRTPLRVTLRGPNGATTSGRNRPDGL